MCVGWSLQHWTCFAGKDGITTSIQIPQTAPYIVSPGNIFFKFEIMAFPGRDVVLPIDARDDLNQSMQIAFHAFSLNSDVAIIDKAFEYIAGNTLKFTGIGGKAFTLQLDSTSQRIWHLEMIINIQNVHLVLLSLESQTK